MGEWLRPADAAWLRMDRPENLMVVNAVMWFDEPMDWNAFRTLVADRLLAWYDRFGQRVVGNPITGLRWETDPEFDLERHLHHMVLAPPGDRAALEAVVAGRVPVPLDPSRPLWEMLLVDGYQGGSAVVARMHHAIADGIALARVLFSIVDEAPPTVPFGGVHLPLPLAVTRDAAAAGLRLVRHPSRLPGLVSDGIGLGRALAKEVLLPPDRGPGLRGRIGREKRVAWSDPIPLEIFREIGRPHHNTVNDVVLTALAGSLRRFATGLGLQAGEIRALVPYNLRPLDQPLPRKLGNRFGLVFVSLPAGIDDPGERLAELKRRMDSIKHSPEGAVSSEVLGIVGASSPFVAAPLISFFAAKASLVMTNVPGPRIPLHLAGRELKGVFGWVPVSGGIGLGVASFSYAGNLTLAVTVDAAVFPDAAVIVDGFRAELDALRSVRA